MHLDWIAIELFLFKFCTINFSSAVLILTSFDDFHLISRLQGCQKHRTVSYIFWKSLYPYSCHIPGQDHAQIVFFTGLACVRVQRRSFLHFQIWQKLDIRSFSDAT